LYGRETKGAAYLGACKTGILHIEVE